MSPHVEAFAASADELVGAPFRLHGRTPEMGLDCVGLVAHALRSSGTTTPRLPTYKLRNAAYDYVPRFARLCGFMPVSEWPSSRNVLRGDLLAVCPGAGQLHLMVASSEDSFVHAHAGLRRIVIVGGPIGWPILHHFRLSEKS